MSLLRKDLQNYTGASNLAFNEKIKNLKGAGADIVHFGFGQSPFPIPQVMVDRLKDFAHINDYLSVAGIEELRVEICRMHKDWDNLSLDPDRLIVAPGSKSLLHLVMAVYGGSVWLAAPAWTTYFPQSVLAHHSPRVIEQRQENGWKLTAEDLDKGLEGEEGPHMLVFTNPGNPSGCVYSREELELLVEVCRKHDVIILSDEIYARLAFGQTPFVSIAELYPERTILTSGFSKWVGAGGWRLGYAHFPPALHQLQEAVLSGASHTHSCAFAPAQYAVAAALKQDRDQLQQYAMKARKILSYVGNYCASELAACGITSQAGEAGYYFMPDFSSLRSELAVKGILTGQQMCDYFLQECQVALMPSSSFLLGHEELTVRFCFVEFDGGKCMLELREKGLEGADFVNTHCPNIVKGVQRLVKLVNSLRQAGN